MYSFDWFDFCPDQRRYDVVIANDLFPNVDQRLSLFIEKFLPVTKSLRLSLTFYDTPRFYQTKRIDGDEILTMLAWDRIQTRQLLDQYKAVIVKPDFSLFEKPNVSVYPNGRQVLILEMRGMLGNS